MISRIASFLLCQAAGALIGWWLGQQNGLEAGLITGALVWLAADVYGGARLLNWLRRSDTEAPRIPGFWGELADRMRRALRNREQQTREAHLRLQEFLSAIQASPNGVVLLDAQGHIEWCNETAAEHFGIDAQRDLQQLIGNLVRDPTFAAYYAGSDYSHEAVMQAPGSASARPLKLAIRLHPYGEGRKLLLSRDVTAVEQAEIMRRDFVANVSHEIRTPLTVLAGFVETLQSIDLPEEERARYLQLMSQQALRMQTLVSDLLTLSRLEGKPLPGALEWNAVSTLTVQCEQEARGLALSLGKDLELRFGQLPDVQIAGSANELLSAMSNLVSNAVRYTPAGGSVTVQWKPLASGRLEFLVRDTGPGIAPEHIPRLTERFYRVDRSRSRETGGTGLGLAIVKHVAQRHGAELHIESKVAVGSTFSIVLPSNRVRAAENPAEPESQTSGAENAI